MNLVGLCVQMGESCITFCLICRYTQEQLYNVVSDVAHYKEFVPWCQRSVVTQERPPDFVEAELEVGFKMFVERYLP